MAMHPRNRSGLRGSPVGVPVVNSLSGVLALLPPSRGKASPERGCRAGLWTLVYSRLREPRERLIDAVDPGLRSAPAIPAPSCTPECCSRALA